MDTPGVNSKTFKLFMHESYFNSLYPKFPYMDKELRLKMYGKLKFKIPFSNLVATETNWMLEFNHVEGKTFYLPLYTFYE